MRANELPEALLEMYFFRPLFDLFEETFGRKVLRVLKPTQRREARLGFDSAWIQPTKPGDSLESIRRDLDNFIHNKSQTRASLFVGYFLQFKVVESMVRRSRTMSKRVRAPYLRSRLSLEPNQGTGISQHETLRRLSLHPNTDVSYACPMLLSEDDLYRKPELDDLRIVSVGTAPLYSSWYGMPHFIVFQNPAAQPLWCSDPVDGIARNPHEWVAGLHLMRADELKTWLHELYIAGGKLDGNTQAPLPSSLTIIALGTKR